MNDNDDFILRMEKCLRDFRPILDGEKIRRRKTAPRFNVFESFGVPRSESVLSNLMAFLLNPTERHDQGDLFLTTFLEFLGGKFDRASTQRANVRSEAELKPYGIVDIRIRLTNGQIILIENKVNAAEGDNQIGRYQDWLQGRLAPGGFSHQLVFLTRKGSQPTSTDRPKEVICLSYSRLADWITARRQQITAPLLGAVIDLYADHCRLIGGIKRAEKMTDAIQQFFLNPYTPERFEDALELAQHVESYRRDLYQQFCRDVAAMLRERLEETSNDDWWEVRFNDVFFDHFPFKDGSGWRIAWRDCQSSRHFAVKVEYESGNGLFYGLTRGFALKNPDSQDPGDKRLQAKLKARGFERSTHRWLGRRFLGDMGLPRFRPSRTDDVLAVHRARLESKDLAVRVFDRVWELFHTIRPELEELNEHWPYPDER